MIHYTLRQLSYFVAAAKRGSTAQAARDLSISQPSISMAISKLEAEFGWQLFLRHPSGGLLLTSEGRHMLAEARHLLAHARDFSEQAEDLGQSVRGELDVGCFLTLTPFFMPQLVIEFTTRYPEAQIRLYEGEQDDLVDGLERGRFPVALLYDEGISGALEMQILKEFWPYVLLPGKHALARKNSIALRDLAQDPMVLLDVKPSRDYFTSLLFRAGIEPDIRFRSPSFETVRALVGNGLGYSILGTRPHGDVTYDGRKLACIPIEDDVKPSRIVLARPARARQTRLVQVFSEFCVRHLSEADSPGRESGRKS